MKWLGGIVLILVILVITTFYIYPLTLMMTKPSPSPTPTPVVFHLASPTPTHTFCTAKDVQPGLELGAAAGNIYGNVTLKNISDKPCAIIGNNKIAVTSSAKNISVKYEGATKPTILLSPNQTVYSKVHYPNGPQCQSGIVTSTISFTYAISSTDTVTFISKPSFPQQQIMTCKSPSELTEVDVWNLSTKPIQ